MKFRALRDKSDSIVCIKQSINNIGAKDTWRSLDGIVDNLYHVSHLDLQSTQFGINGVFRYDDSDNPFDLLVVLGRCVLRLRDIVWTNPGRIALQEFFSEPGSSALTLRDIDEALSARKETPPAYCPQAFRESEG